MRLAVWSPLPPSPSGIADYVAEQLPRLRRHAEVLTVAEDPGPARPEADLDLYHLGNSPAHGYVYRAALARPGVVVLHDWCLHHLVLSETVAQGDRRTYLREMRRSYGEEGTFVGRQISVALGGDFWPSLFPLNDRVLETSLAVVGLTGYVSSRASRRLPARPVLQLPHHVFLPLDPLPSREDARRALGLPQDALVLTAPGLGTVSKRLDLAITTAARLRARFPALLLVVAGAVDLGLPLAALARGAGIGEGLVVAGRLSIQDFVRHLVAADIVLSLRFPTHGEISGALLRTLGVGRPALVTAGTPAALEFPEGVVVPVDPGPREATAIEAVLGSLIDDTDLRETIGRLAREHVLEHHDLPATVDRLAEFLESVAAKKEDLLREVRACRPPDDSLLGFMLDEVRRCAHGLGLPGIPEGVEGLFSDLGKEPS